MGGIRAGAPFVLVSHNVVKCMDAALPASLSPIVHQALRDMGFEGIALADDLSVEALGACAAEGSVAVQALRAGNDMIVTSDFEAQISEILDAVRGGALDESAVNAACLRVLRVKMQQGLLKI